MYIKAVYIAHFALNFAEIGVTTFVTTSLPLFDFFKIVVTKTANPRRCQAQQSYHSPSRRRNKWLRLSAVVVTASPLSRLLVPPAARR